MSVEAFLLSEPFPPSSALPVVTDACLPTLHRFAQGKPGQVVWPGLFPRAQVKLARLLLASVGQFDPAELLTVASSQYGGDLPIVSKATRRYDAHDAFACALVHPAVSAEARAALVTEVLLHRGARRHRGWRSRRKSFAVARWAVQVGAVDPTLLSPMLAQQLLAPPTGLETADFPEAPEGAAAAVACFAARWPRFRSLLRRERAADRWLDYVGIAELGHRHFAAFASGCRAPWIQGVFEAMEHVLTCGDASAQNLVVVGLFEAVQGDAYRAGAVGERYESALPPRARRAWADLIEGWTGPGIRDLAAWRSKGGRTQKV